MILRAIALLFLCATLHFAAWAQAEAEAEAEAFEDKLQGLLSDYRAEYGFPGATAAVALANGDIVAVATGFADIQAGTAMSPDSRMLAASIGKTFVAATVLALRADGKLGLNDRISRYLGNREWFSRLPNHDTMTVAHLLQHTSGLSDHVHADAFGGEMMARVADGTRAVTPEEAIAFVLDAEPLFPAGAGWAYTDTGYLLLGLIIEAVGDLPYYKQLEERFIKPLALADTSPSNKRTITGLAVGYTALDNPFGIPPRTMDGNGRLFWDPAVEWTGGGLVSTSRDLAVWGRALFAGTAMNNPYLGVLLEGVAVAPDAPGQRYGAGVAIREDTRRGRVYGHGGWIPGYVSSLRHYAEHGVTIAFQINSDVGIVDRSSDVVPSLETALADLVLDFRAEEGAP